MTGDTSARARQRPANHASSGSNAVTGSPRHHGSNVSATEASVATGNHQSGRRSCRGHLSVITLRVAERPRRTIQRVRCQGRGHLDLSDAVRDRVQPGGGCTVRSVEICPRGSRSPDSCGSLGDGRGGSRQRTFPRLAGRNAISWARPTSHTAPGTIYSPWCRQRPRQQGDDSRDAVSLEAPSTLSLMSR
jgi:hypothetical protein